MEPKRISIVFDEAEANRLWEEATGGPVPSAPDPRVTYRFPFSVPDGAGGRRAALLCVQSSEVSDQLAAALGRATGRVLALVDESGAPVEIGTSALIDWAYRLVSPLQGQVDEMVRLRFSELGRRGGAARSERKTAAARLNARFADGRPPTTRSGAIRADIRHALEPVLGRPLPAEQSAARRLVHRMSSKAVRDRAWDELRPALPEETARAVGDLLGRLDEAEREEGRAKPPRRPGRPRKEEPAPAPPVRSGTWGGGPVLPSE